MDNFFFHKKQKVFAKKAPLFQFFKTWLKEMISLRQWKAQSRRKFRWEVAMQNTTEETRLAITRELKNESNMTDWQTSMSYTLLAELDSEKFITKNLPW